MTLADTGALVHRELMRLRQSGRLSFEDRRHFLPHAAVVLLFSHRGHRAAQPGQRRGGDQAFVTLDTAVADGGGAGRGARCDGGQCRAGRAGFDWTHACSGGRDALVWRRQRGRHRRGAGVSERTVRRDWDKARAFLRTLLRA